MWATSFPPRLAVLSFLGQQETFSQWLLQHCWVVALCKLRSWFSLHSCSQKVHESQALQEEKWEDEKITREIGLSWMHSRHQFLVGKKGYPYTVMCFQPVYSTCMDTKTRLPFPSKAPSRNSSLLLWILCSMGLHNRTYLYEYLHTTSFNKKYVSLARKHFRALVFAEGFLQIGTSM